MQPPVHIAKRRSLPAPGHFELAPHRILAMKQSMQVERHLDTTKEDIAYPPPGGALAPTTKTLQQQLLQHRLQQKMTKHVSPQMLYQEFQMMQINSSSSTTTVSSAPTPSTSSAGGDEPPLPSSTPPPGPSTTSAPLNAPLSGPQGGHPLPFPSSTSYMPLDAFHHQLPGAPVVPGASASRRTLRNPTEGATGHAVLPPPGLDDILSMGLLPGQKWRGMPRPGPFKLGQPLPGVVPEEADWGEKVGGAQLTTQLSTTLEDVDGEGSAEQENNTTSTNMDIS